MFNIAWYYSSMNALRCAIMERRITRQHAKELKLLNIKLIRVDEDSYRVRSDSDHFDFEEDLETVGDNNNCADALVQLTPNSDCLDSLTCCGHHGNDRRLSVDTSGFETASLRSIASSFSVRSDISDLSKKDYNNDKCFEDNTNETQTSNVNIPSCLGTVRKRKNSSPARRCARGDSDDDAQVPQTCKRLKTFDNEPSAGICKFPIINKASIRDKLKPKPSAPAKLRERVRTVAIWRPPLAEQSQNLKQPAVNMNLNQKNRVPMLPIDYSNTPNMVSPPDPLTPPLTPVINYKKQLLQLHQQQMAAAAQEAINSRVPIEKTTRNNRKVALSTPTRKRTAAIRDRGNISKRQLRVSPEMLRPEVFKENESVRERLTKQGNETIPLGPNSPFLRTMLQEAERADMSSSLITPPADILGTDPLLHSASYLHNLGALPDEESTAMTSLDMLRILPEWRRKHPILIRVSDSILISELANKTKPPLVWLPTWVETNPECNAFQHKMQEYIGNMYRDLKRTTDNLPLPASNIASVVFKSNFRLLEGGFWELCLLQRLAYKDPRGKDFFISRAEAFLSKLGLYRYYNMYQAEHSKGAILVYIICFALEHNIVLATILDRHPLLLSSRLKYLMNVRNELVQSKLNLSIRSPPKMIRPQIVTNHINQVPTSELTNYNHPQASERTITPAENKTSIVEIEATQLPTKPDAPQQVSVIKSTADARKDFKYAPRPEWMVNAEAIPYMTGQYLVMDPVKGRRVVKTWRPTIVLSDSDDEADNTRRSAKERSNGSMGEQPISSLVDGYSNLYNFQKHLADQKPPSDDATDLSKSPNRQMRSCLQSNAVPLNFLPNYHKDLTSKTNASIVINNHEKIEPNNNHSISKIMETTTQTRDSTIKSPKHQAMTYQTTINDLTPQKSGINQAAATNNLSAFTERLTPQNQLNSSYNRSVSTNLDEMAESLINPATLKRRLSQQLSSNNRNIDDNQCAKIPKHQIQMRPLVDMVKATMSVDSQVLIENGRQQIHPNNTGRVASIGEMVKSPRENTFGFQRQLSQLSNSSGTGSMTGERPATLHPQEYVLEMKIVEEMNIPDDFKNFYEYVTKSQITNGNEPICFNTFLELHNAGNLKMYHKKYVDYLKMKESNFLNK